MAGKIPFWLTEGDCKIARQVCEYRKLKMRWCKLERMFNMPVKELKKLQCLYRASLEDKDQVEPEEK